MYEIDLVLLRKTLCKGVRILVAVRMMAKEIDKDSDELHSLERQFRGAAGQCQNAERLMGKGESVTIKRT